LTSIELKAARKQLGYSQAVLAEKVGYTPNSIARFEQPKGGFPIPKSVAILVTLSHQERQADANR
jgi:transcriptional regulator with XRE-family HTH domain